MSNTTGVPVTVERWFYGTTNHNMERCTMSNYSTPATGALSVPFTEDDEPDLERAHAEVDASADDVGAFIVDRDDSVKVDELFYSHGSLGVTALLADWYVKLEIPLRPNRKLRELLHDINESFDIASRESGYYLSNDDVDFVETFTPDGQGRVTLGRKYANKDVKLVGFIEDSEYTSDGSSEIWTGID